MKISELKENDIFTGSLAVKEATVNQFGMTAVLFDDSGEISASRFGYKDVGLFRGDIVEVSGTISVTDDYKLLNIDEIKPTGKKIIEKKEQVKLSQLKAGDPFSGVLLVKQVSPRKDKNNKTYLDMTLSDSTAEMDAMLWNNVPEDSQLPKPNAVVLVKADVQEFRGRLQLRLLSMKAADRDRTDMSQLVPSAPETAEGMLAELNACLAGMKNRMLASIVEKVIEPYVEKLMYYPAATRIHHAYRSGLLHHTLSMLRMAEKVCEVYPTLDSELLYAGVILHDINKIDEMNADENGIATEYSADGQLIGHLVRGAAVVDAACVQCGADDETRLLLEHMVLSSHGQAEYGSPRPPMFPEAEVLHTLDMLDARLNEMNRELEGIDEGSFTEKIWSLDRRLYKKTTRK